MTWLPICLQSLIFIFSFKSLTRLCGPVADIGWSRAVLTSWLVSVFDGGFGGCNASLLGLRRISRGGAYGDSSILGFSVVQAVGLTASTPGVERIDGCHCLCYCRREMEPLEMTL